MNTVADNRRVNFRKLVDELSGPREAGFKLKMGESQISQLISEHIKKNMGSTLARKIEKKVGLPQGSLSQETGADGRQIRSVPIVDDNDAGSTIFATEEYDDTMSRKRVIWDNSNPYRPIGPLVAFYLPDNALGGTAHEADLAIFDCWPRSKGKPDRVQVGSVVLLEHKGRLLARIIKQAEDGGLLFIAASDLFASVKKENADDILGVMVEVRWLRPRAIQS